MPRTKGYTCQNLSGYEKLSLLRNYIFCVGGYLFMSDWIKIKTSSRIPKHELKYYYPILVLMRDSMDVMIAGINSKKLREKLSKDIEHTC